MLTQISSIRPSAMRKTFVPVTSIVLPEAGMTKKLSSLGAGHRPTDRHLVRFGDLVVNREAQVGKRRERPRSQP
jgi:hypothetical protein